MRYFKCNSGMQITFSGLNVISLIIRDSRINPNLSIRILYYLPPLISNGHH
jgi:hypothetical protein